MIINYIISFSSQNYFWYGVNKYKPYILKIMNILALMIRVMITKTLVYLNTFHKDYEMITVLFGASKQLEYKIWCKRHVFDLTRLQELNS